MTALGLDSAEWSTGKRVVVIGAVGGTIGGMMLALIEMLYGWLSDAHTFWDAPMAIWAGSVGSSTSAAQATTSARSSSGWAAT